MRNARRHILWTAACVATVAAVLSCQCSATDNIARWCWNDFPPLSAASAPSVCADPSADRQVKEALTRVCLQNPVTADRLASQKAIVIGFLGGFAKPDDLNHPEVWFAKYLRQRYPSAVYAVVFSNHQADAALHALFNLLDTDCDGTVTDSEKENARIILYGHSWGASETAAFARKLGKLGIPVLLTVQIDIVGKPGQTPLEIPSNVREAVNFFQTTGGFLRGQSRIIAADPVKTEIIGNFRMSYKTHAVDCRNFPWFARTLNKPHHEIENDSRVWEQVYSLIEADLRGETQDASWAGLDER